MATAQIQINCPDCHSVDDPADCPTCSGERTTVVRFNEDLGYQELPAPTGFVRIIKEDGATVVHVFDLYHVLHWSVTITSLAPNDLIDATVRRALEALS